MSQIKYDLPYEEKAVVVGPKGEKVEVGNVLERKEDTENKIISFTVELLPQLPEEFKVAIEKEPRMLQIIRVPKPATSILILP